MNLTTKRLILTLLAGSLVGAIFVISKLLLGRGLSPLIVSLIQTAGAAAVLLAVQRARGARLPLDPASRRFYLIAALIAVAGSALLGNWVLARIPAGIFTVVVTLSPMFTSLFNALVERRWPSPTAMLGTGLGLLGVLLVLVPRAKAVEAEQALALTVALGVPVLLAIGNVYRSRHWPTGLSAPMSSAGTMLVQALAVLPLIAVSGQRASVEQLAASWPLLLAMVLVTLSANVAAAALQRIADSVAYSQIGYVIALTGVVWGAVLFGERLGWSFVPALALVFAGVVLANRRVVAANATVAVSPALPALNGAR
ncbi:DMT family transporter [Lysobacter sp. cf310]|uniref:DMT family transporter n=1 Tax=Lysobacter sp. cf310 TaxID=1761790 RepID=UPI0008F16867|nr:DMT family transporter [Lysobacter sp. cf310]SFL10883.1 EamA-like transporter family protein [Lysobacter sp. cf310]